jgi:hypothetical protein
MPPMQADIVALGNEGPYRIRVPHAHGVIVEIVPSIDQALQRLGELDALVAAAQGFNHAEPL